MTCREMSRTTKEPCGKPLPCADHSTTTNAPESAREVCDGYVWCDHYCNVHEDSLDPYSYGSQQCGAEDHSPIYRLSTPAAPQPETEGMTFDEWDVLPRDEEVPSLMAAWESLEPIADGGFAHFSNGYRMAMSYARKRIAAWTAAKGGR